MFKFNSRAAGKLPSLRGKGLPRGGESGPVKAQHSEPMVHTYTSLISSCMSFRVNVLINEISVEYLIDTGAAVPLLHLKTSGSNLKKEGLSGYCRSGLDRS